MSKNKKKKLGKELIAVVCVLAVLAGGVWYLRTQQNHSDTQNTEGTSGENAAAGAEEGVASGSTSGTAERASVEDTEDSSAVENQEEQVSETPAATAAPTDTPTPEPTLEVQTVSGENLHSAHAILIRAEDGAVMMEKAASEQTYPASITKVMTAILAIEQLADLEEQVTVPEDIFEELTAQGASVAGFDPYEQLSVRSLLYGVLLPSGADACLTLAERISGSEESFVQMMNEKAAELGLEGTHFMNCTGLHDSQHYTTCADVAELADAQDLKSCGT